MKLHTGNIEVMCHGLTYVSVCTSFPPLMCWSLGSRWCSSKESSCQCRRCKKHGFHPWAGKIDLLKKETVTHASILAWRIQWTEEPGRQQSMGVAKSWMQLSTHIRNIEAISHGLTVSTSFWPIMCSKFSKPGFNST